MIIYKLNEIFSILIQNHKVVSERIARENILNVDLLNFIGAELHKSVLQAQILPFTFCPIPGILSFV